MGRGSRQVPGPASGDLELQYLLDTNVLSEAVKPRPHPLTLENLRLYRQEVATAAPVWKELCFGIARLPRSHRQERLESYLRDLMRSDLPILPYEARAAEWHARERARLEKAGRTPPYVDGQIAAIARVHGLVLVTSNTSDFEAFEDLEVESWTR